MQPSCLPSSFTGARVAVYGGGVSGSAVLRRLLREGAEVTLWEDAPHRLPPTAAAVAVSPPGEGRFDFVFRSPGIRPDAPALLRAAASGAVCSSECALFLARCPCPVIGVTGSDGKTTTASLTAAILQAELAPLGRRAYVGGNIGTSLLDALEFMSPKDMAVLELSSFQLADLSPRLAAAAITNLSPNHLNWHRDYGEYAAAKERILQNTSRAVLNGGDAGSTLFLAKKEKLLFSAKRQEEEMAALYRGIPFLTLRDGMVLYRDGRDRIPLLPRVLFAPPGLHNAENLLCAIGLCRGFASLSAIKAGVEGFRGVPHRMQVLGEKGGIWWVDSAIDTSPLRTETTLRAMERPCVVIVGGQKKGLPLSPLADALCRYARGAVTMGESGPEIAGLLQGTALPHAQATGMQEAVEKALALAKPGDALLLSPGCTSYDAYTGYREKGAHFARLFAQAAGTK